MSLLLEEALKLTVSERIRLADDLYDSVSGSPGSFRLTDAQVAEIERRIEDHRENPDGNVSWGEVRDAALTR